jgi:hypothetical protein
MLQEMHRRVVGYYTREWIIYVLENGESMFDEETSVQFVGIQ